MKELLPFWPQIFIILYLIGGYIREWILDGTERKVNFSPTKSMVIQVLYLWVVIQGGFFNYWGGAQWIYAILQVVVFILLIFIAINGNDLKKKTTKVIESNIIGTLLVFGLFYWGGFFDSFIQFLMK